SERQSKPFLRAICSVISVDFAEIPHAPPTACGNTANDTGPDPHRIAGDKQMEAILDQTPEQQAAASATFTGTLTDKL
ncbi:hypothetical protein ACXIU3_24480, partial [Vibrio parahaemolyticus]